ncbi:MAG: L-aspartate oxidase [Gammaproteobacteria bacterium]|jgi:L-aspartate oxidase|nr:L-aspartate oxidase [Gammaproteobacteria bacterium]MBT4493975.1 L-aspartate oxidase [Gammaproteobacteria bacterium]MBT7371827.1 L-aspartate oxidase [Gammaproteobacteria bacterium]
MADIQHQCDVLIIGSGAAGMTLALKLSKSLRIMMLCKEDPTEGSTYYAQGGVAAVLDEYDSVDSHIDDTLVAGAGLCHKDVVEFTVKRSAETINWLVDLGVKFDTRTQSDGSEEFHLTMEGGHSHRRVIHAADATGKEIAETLSDHLARNDNVTVMPKYVAVDLITRDKVGLKGQDVVGAYALNLSTQQVELFQARFVILATGGASKVYLYTSNPDTASGDGLAMAWRAGCRVANLEFNQFHPTCLYHPDAKSFLITEALRGEGAKLILPNGHRFMPYFDDRAELAPRDIVARAIDHEMKRIGCDCVYLDISHKDEAFISSHFPNIHARCLELGIDMTREPIPIVPAAHYTCGGIVTGKDGTTDLPNLYAIGECSFTGLHGANRMASNSLLECMVFAAAAAEHINAQGTALDRPINIPPWDETQVTNSDEDVIISHNWDELRRFMWDYVGIVRTDKRLQRARRRIQLLQQEVTEYYSHYRISNDLIELRNLILVADLMVQCAIRRKESRGLHYTLDHPSMQQNAADTVLTPPSYG